MKIKIFIIVASIIILCSPLYGYRDNIHNKATGEAVNASSFLTYMSNYLGYDSRTEFSDGLFNRKTAKVWIESGGVEEDNFPRYLNHFYDPTTEKGIFFLLQQNSSKVWGKNLIGNDWDWASARDYFYEALTSTNSYVRETRLAATFRAVGQVMHLVEDLASPAHVRNDIHMPTTRDRDFYEDYTERKYNPSEGVIPYSGYLPVDLSTFSSFDTFWKNNGKGLSEFTNNNFLSRDTNIDDNAYSSPVSIGEWLALETPDPGKPPVYVRYLQGYATDPYRPDKSAPINKLAAFSYFDFEMKRLDPSKAVYTLNDGVHKEYAQFLVPRAVGYSAGLLNYFFRGTLEISRPAQLVYAIADGSVIPQKFTSLSATVKNKTVGESFSGGTVKAVAKYKIIDNYAPDLSAYPPDGTTQQGASYVYSTSDPISVGSLDAPTELTFDFSNNPIPAGITDLSLMVIAKGTLGNEVDIAVAIGTKDLSEPTHQVLWNLTDMYSLNNVLYTKNQIVSDTTLASQVDYNHNGIFSESGEPYIDPHNFSLEIGYLDTGATSYYRVANVSLPAGRHIRLLGIFDPLTPINMIVDWQDDRTDSFFEATINPAINQSEGNTFAASPVNAFRKDLDNKSFMQHFNIGLLYCKPVTYDVNGKSYCAYQDGMSILAIKDPYPVIIE